MHSRQKGVLRTCWNKHDLLSYCNLLLLVLLCLLFSFVSFSHKFQYFRTITIRGCGAVHFHFSASYIIFVLCSLVYQRISFGLLKHLYLFLTYYNAMRSSSLTCQTKLIIKLKPISSLTWPTWTSRSLYQVLPNCYFLKLLQPPIRCSSIHLLAC